MSELHPVRFTEEQIDFLEFAIGEKLMEYWDEECVDILTTIKEAKEEKDVYLVYSYPYEGEEVFVTYYSLVGFIKATKESLEERAVSYIKKHYTFENAAYRSYDCGGGLCIEITEVTLLEAKTHTFEFQKLVFNSDGFGDE